METAEQLAFLQWWECYTYLGFCFSQAISEGAFYALLGSSLNRVH